jgi:Glycosyl hydrolases family 31
MPRLTPARRAVLVASLSTAAAGGALTSPPSAAAARAASGAHDRRPDLSGPRQSAHHHPVCAAVVPGRQRADATGMPVTRPLWLQFPPDHAAFRVDQEWMFGSELLVAPVVRAGAHTRSVSFPPGCWQSPSGARHHGPGRATVAAPLDTLLYVAVCGTHLLAGGAR